MSPRPIPRRLGALLRISILDAKPNCKIWSFRDGLFLIEVPVRRKEENLKSAYQNIQPRLLKHCWVYLEHAPRYFFIAAPLTLSASKCYFKKAFRVCGICKFSSIRIKSMISVLSSNRLTSWNECCSLIHCGTLGSWLRRQKIIASVLSHWHCKVWSHEARHPSLSSSWLPLLQDFWSFCSFFSKVWMTLSLLLRALILCLSVAAVFRRWDITKCCALENIG